MATRPSGLRQPSASAVRSSNTNLTSSSNAGAETPAATPAKSSAASMSRLPSSSSIRRKITTPGIQAPGSRDSGLATDVDNFLIGDTVYVNGDPTKRGKICFIGEVAFAKGDFAGIVLDLPIGNHDGVVQGKRYFQCAPSHGLFTKLSRLSRDPILESPSTPRAPQSTASSVIVSPDPQISSAASVTERTPSPSGLRTPMRASSLALNSSLSIGERVIVASATGGTKIGILKYLGTTEFAPGEWAGVELLTPMGKNNGTVGGKSYFTCKDKHGLFVPASKVISSPVNKTPRRHGSRESLISVSSMASSAASRNIRRPSMRDSQCLPTCSLQSVLAEKEKHLEQLIKERELDRVDLANLSRQFEEKKLEIRKLQADCAIYQQQLQTSNVDSEEVTRLQNALEEERRKLEDLQYSFDEEKILKADLQTHVDSLNAKLSEKSQVSTESRAETEELKKEIETLKASLAKAESERKKVAANLSDSQAQTAAHEQTIEDLNRRMNSLNEELTKSIERRQTLVAAHQEELSGLKKTTADQAENINKLRLQLDEKKRREEEFKDRQQKLLAEVENVHKQKCSLEAEIVDLVNSKSDTSELLSSKIKDLSEEVQDLRAKLQSTEEDKAVLRRINAEFKTRVAQQEQTEANLKKELEDSLAKSANAKTESEKELTEQILTLRSESQKLESTIKEKDQMILELQKNVRSAEENIRTVSSSSQESSQLVDSLKSELAEVTKKLAEVQDTVKNLGNEKEELADATRKKEAELNQKNNELIKQNRSLSDQLAASNEELNSLKKKIENLSSEVSQIKAESDEKTNKLKSLEEEVDALKKKTEEDGCALDNLAGQVQSLKKDKSNLKEQIANYKADSSRFQEIEQALSQELAVLRNKLEQKNKAVADLEKELADKKADIESSKASMLDANSPQAHIEFLNSIIVDLQRKNEELNIKLNVLINGGVDADANSNRVGVVAAAGSASSKSFQPLRLYCDICEKFDLHETEDCPAQVTEDNNTNTHYGAVRGEPRPYCESCEIFGHATGECDDQETY